jgi:hypothetical protein
MAWLCLPWSTMLCTKGAVWPKDVRLKSVVIVVNQCSCNVACGRSMLHCKQLCCSIAVYTVTSCHAPSPRTGCYCMPWHAPS